MSIIYTGEKDPRAYKEVLGKYIGERLENDEKFVYLDADLANCICSGGHIGKYDRAIDCGISEANMIGIGSGLSSVGFKPLCHSFGPFVSRRAYDQVFLSGAYAKNSLTIVGTDPGITAALNGGTHMPFEDVALYRAIPGAVICDVTDVNMLKAFLDMSLEFHGINYARVGRKESYPVYSDDTKFEFGKGFVVRDGKDAVIIASGIMVHEAMMAADNLAKEGISCAVIDPFTIKPLDVELIREYAKKCGVVLVAENHNKIGGLTSAVTETLAGMQYKFSYVAVEDEFGEVGPTDYLRKRFDLTNEHIERNIREMLK